MSLHEDIQALKKAQGVIPPVKGKVEKKTMNELKKEISKGAE